MVKEKYIVTTKTMHEWGDHIFTTQHDTIIECYEWITRVRHNDCLIQWVINVIDFEALETRTIERWENCEKSHSNLNIKRG